MGEKGSRRIAGEGTREARGAWGRGVWPTEGHEEGMNRARGVWGNGGGEMECRARGVWRRGIRCRGSMGKGMPLHCTLPYSVHVEQQRAAMGLGPEPDWAEAGAATIAWPS